MADTTAQQARALKFKELHVKGDPIILFNAWDGGTAKAIADCGAKAIATGDHPVGFAHGFTDDDFEDFTFDIYLGTVREIIKRIGDLPFSMDISNGEGLTMDQLQERIRIVLDAGVVGINFEDRLPDSSGVIPIADQVLKIEAIRAAAKDYGVELFINARTDLFSTSNDDPRSLLEEAVKRAEAFQAAGADGFFAPVLTDIEFIKRLVSDIELPLNIIKIPNAPSTKELADVGVARISYGPIPQVRMTEWLKGQATTALRGEE